MSILINGMEMPKDQHTITITICHDGYAVVEFRDRDNYPAKIEAYQAVSIPKHGDLIDRDDVKYDWDEDAQTWGYDIYSAPVVIPADKEDE